MKTIKMNKVLIALDYNPTAKKIAEVGFSLARAMQSEIILLHIISTPVDYASTAYDPIMGFGGFANLDLHQPDIKQLTNSAFDFLNNVKKHLGDSKIDTIVKEGEYADAILKTANEIKADVIVIGSHSKKWLETILLGSTTKEVLNQSNIPLFIVPTKKKV
ncbi:universal stress protein [Flavobacterium sp.]|jgi:nucleotide-binding universal stress UspA family protein|uniref:universal stress protein n=1 Tax=Flavobacterium sp. TaxID=239 RepID=UPI0037522C94